VVSGEAGFLASRRGPGASRLSAGRRRQHTINVVIWPAEDTAGALADARSLRGFQLRHWTRDAMAFWAVSDLNDLELDQFVHALQPLEVR
jgi:anti-sigma factor RsiW